MTDKKLPCKLPIASNKRQEEMKQSETDGVLGLKYAETSEFKLKEVSCDELKDELEYEKASLTKDIVRLRKEKEMLIGKIKTSTNGETQGTSEILERLRHESEKNRELTEKLESLEKELETLQCRLKETQEITSESVVGLSEQLLAKDSIIGDLGAMHTKVQEQNRQMCFLLCEALGKCGLLMSEAEVASTLAAGRTHSIAQLLLSAIEKKSTTEKPVNEKQCQTVFHSSECTTSIGALPDPLTARKTRSNDVSVQTFLEESLNTEVKSNIINYAQKRIDTECQTAFEFPSKVHEGCKMTISRLEKDLRALRKYRRMKKSTSNCEKMTESYIQQTGPEVNHFEHQIEQRKHGSLAPVDNQILNKTSKSSERFGLPDSTSGTPLKSYSWKKDNELKEMVNMLERRRCALEMMQDRILHHRELCTKVGNQKIKNLARLSILETLTEYVNVVPKREVNCV